MFGLEKNEHVELEGGEFDIISVTSGLSVELVLTMVDVNCAPDTDVPWVIVPEPDLINCDPCISQRCLSQLDKAFCYESRNQTLRDTKRCIFQRGYHSVPNSSTFATGCLASRVGLKSPTLVAWPLRVTAASTKYLSRTSSSTVEANTRWNSRTEGETVFVVL